jgi:small subunit ribosomal protein S19
MVDIQAKRRKDRKKIEVRKKEFRYYGLSLEEMQKLSLEELMPLLPSWIRRTFKRGLTYEQNKLLEDLKNTPHDVVVKTHSRDMPILPSFIGRNIQIHNGKEFERINIQPQMVGHYLGEFALTRKKVRHTGPGVGATRGSKFMPLK